MYPRWLYVSLLGLATGSLQFAARFGPEWQVYPAFAVAFAVGTVVFYHGERRVTSGPIFANVAIAMVLGTVASTVFTAGLLIWILAVPWDLALWRAGLLLWSHALGIDFAIVAAFFVVGLVASLY